MAGRVKGTSITALAGADLRGKECYIVKLTTDTNGKSTAVLAAAATDAISGTLEEAPQGATGLCSIDHISGGAIGKVKLGANTSKGAYLTSNGSGLAIATTNAGDSVFGRLLHDGLQNEIVAYEKMFFRY